MYAKSYFVRFFCGFLNDAGTFSKWHVTKSEKKKKMQFRTQGKVGLPVLSLALRSCKVSDNFTVRQVVMKMEIRNGGKGRKKV